MSAAKRGKPRKSKQKIQGGFFAMPHSVLKSQECCNLSYSAFKLLADVCVQYNGNNNGSLVATSSYLNKFGWNSNATIHKALKELRDTGFLILTRQGMRYPSPQPSLFAISWLPLHYKIDLDFEPSFYERKEFLPKIIFNRKRVWGLG